MKLIVNKENNQTIEYKIREQLDFSIVKTQESISSTETKDLVGISIAKNSKLDSFFINKEEDDLSVYLIENMLLLNFKSESKHYCFYPLPLEYLQQLEETHNINFIVTKNNKIRYCLTTTLRGEDS